jgi:hypothetical protein
MRDQTLLYWGIVVTLFLFFSLVLTARQLFENYMERRKRDQG